MSRQSAILYCLLALQRASSNVVDKTSVPAAMQEYVELMNELEVLRSKVGEKDE